MGPKTGLLKCMHFSSKMNVCLILQVPLRYGVNGIKTFFCVIETGNKLERLSLSYWWAKTKPSGFSAHSVGTLKYYKREKILASHKMGISISKGRY